MVAAVNLQDVLKRDDVWQASARSYKKHSLSTSYSALDDVLHLSGWPMNRLTELLLERMHIGEMSLILPAIQQAMQKGGQVFLIEPPLTPYAPAWLKVGIDIQRLNIVKNCSEKDGLWAAEQIMSEPGVACCIFWPPKDHLSNKVLKRLQVAAEQGSQLNFIMRTEKVVVQSSPASLRLRISPVKAGISSTTRQLQLEVLKQGGGWAGQTLQVEV